MNPGVLFVSPHPQDAGRLIELLGPLSLQLEHVTNFSRARARLKKQRFAVIVTEATLPDGTWRDMVALVAELKCNAEVIVTRPFADPRFWAEVLNLGAYDLIPQPFNEGEVRRIVSNACSRVKNRRAMRATI